MIILPLNISFVRWAEALRNENNNEEIPLVTDEKEWKNFVNSLLLNQAFNGYDIPLPDNYENWQDWANRFNINIGV